MDRLDAARAAKAVVGAPVVDLLDADLAHGRRAHEARLDRDVQRDAPQRGLPHFAAGRVVGVSRDGEDVVELRGEGPHELRGDRVGPVGEEVAQGVELGVEGRVAAFVCAVAAAGDDAAVVDEDAANGDLFCVERLLCLELRLRGSGSARRVGRWRGSAG